MKLEVFWFSNILLSYTRLYKKLVEIRQNVKTQKTRTGKIYCASSHPYREELILCYFWNYFVIYYSLK